MNTPTRNLTVDFFRGIALTIIFVNHMPLSDWQLYTPSRFGFSDAAETFVFLSGFVAAQAYGRSFQSAGLGAGTIRVLYRCVQIYGAHLASFFLMAVLCAVANRWTTEPDYITRLNIQFFFDQTQEAMLTLFSLRYVPNMFDILPLYLVMLLWVPVVWSLSQVHRALALGFSVAVYAAMWTFGWELPADPLSDRPWYFNPFGWQFMFFNGFAFGAGWLRCPGPNRALLAACLAFVACAIPLAHEPSFRTVEPLGSLRATLEPVLDKNHLGILRWLHFLALAYLMARLFAWKPQWLEARPARWIIRMGQQSLPIFVLCTLLSYIGGILLDQIARNALTTAWINLGGLALLLAAARGLAWLDGKPWKAASPAYPAPDNARRPVLSAVWPALRRPLQLAVPVALAAVPLLLLRPGDAGNDDAPTITASLSPDEALHGATKTEADEPVQWQDGI